MISKLSLRSVSWVSAAHEVASKPTLSRSGVSKAAAQPRLREAAAPIDGGNSRRGCGSKGSPHRAVAATATATGKAGAKLNPSGSAAASAIVESPPQAPTQQPAGKLHQPAGKSQQPAGKSQRPAGKSPEEARPDIVAQYPPVSMRVVGVSFEGRQQLLAGIGAGAAVMFVWEPSNVYDPDAVIVQTLHGHSMGYIPREQTHNFRQPVSFGRVESIGAEHWTGNFGLTVEAHPGLPALAVDAVPESLRKETSLKARLPPASWDALRHTAYTRASHRCEVSGGVGPKWPVNAEPMWAIDDAARTMRLYGVAALAPQVAASKNLERLPSNSSAATEAVSTLQSINGWSEEECSIYLNHIEMLGLIRAQGAAWQLDLSWLDTQGIDQTAPPSS